MKKLAVIYGGNSFEHDVSCRSLKSFVNNVDLSKYKLSTIFVDKSGEWYINDVKINNVAAYLKYFDVVFPLIHGFSGEDGRIQGLLEMFDICYVGSGVISSAICMDKSYCKILLDSIGICQVPYVIVKHDTKIKNITEKLKYPVIVKPSNGGSSIGISVVYNNRELVKALKNAFKYDSKIVVEKYIKARELEVGILDHNGLTCSCIGEIVSNGFYDYESKYEKNTELIVDTKIADNIKKEIKIVSKKIFKFLECSGYARCDFLYDENNDVLYFNEINTIPGFTEISMFPKLFIHDGISYQKIIDVLIDNALKK